MRRKVRISSGVASRYRKTEARRGTFSIVALDPSTGELGVAVASRYFDAGFALAWLEAGVGAVATQAWVNARLGPKGIKALRDGIGATEAISRILSEDDEADRRQVGIVDFNGHSASFTGKETPPWSGHLTAENVAVQGNILAGPAVVESMLDTFLTTGGPLSERLIAALESGEAHGGDSRGKQSAALYVTRKRGGFQGVDDRLVELKVSDHPEPIVELRRLSNMWRYFYLVPAYSRLAEEEPELSSTFLDYVLRFLHSALEEEIESPEVYNSLAWHLALREAYPEEALLAAKKAYDLAPDDPNVLDTLAEAHFSAGDHDEAIHWEEEAIRISPENTFFKEQLAKFRRSA